MFNQKRVTLIRGWFSQEADIYWMLTIGQYLWGLLLTRERHQLEGSA